MRRVVVAILAALVLVACTVDNTQRRFDELAPRPAVHRFEPDNIEELEEGVPNIVRGRMGNDAEIVFQFNDYYNPTRPTGGHNRVSLEILEVIRGGLSVGETISVLEPYRIEDRVLFTIADYLPSTPGREYIFLLGYKQGEENWPNGDQIPEEYVGAHFVWRGMFGRFPVPERPIREYTREELSLTPYADMELYLRLWQEAIDTYIN